MTQSIGPIDLVMRHLNLDFKAACRWLADENNIILEEWKPQTSDISHQTSFDASRYARYFDHPFLNEPARKFLFDERRLDSRVVRWCRLTSWTDKQGTPWLQIPYYDRSGRLTGVQNRNLGLTPIPSPKGDGSLTLQGEVGGGAPRFRFPSGSKCGIYNLPVLNLLKPGEPLFITEGSSDCWAMLSAGHKAIAIPSATLAFGGQSLCNPLRCSQRGQSPLHLPHVPRPRRPRRAPLPATAEGLALAPAPPVATRLQGLQRLLPHAPPQATLIGPRYQAGNHPLPA